MSVSSVGASLGGTENRSLTFKRASDAGSLYSNPLSSRAKPLRDTLKIIRPNMLSSDTFLLNFLLLWPRIAWVYACVITKVTCKKLSLKMCRVAISGPRDFCFLIRHLKYLLYKNSAAPLEDEIE
jgi:hypothetical protein